MYGSRMGQKTRFPGNKFVLLCVSDTDIIIKTMHFTKPPLSLPSVLLLLASRYLTIFGTRTKPQYSRDFLKYEYLNFWLHLMSIPKSAKQVPSSGLLMFSWQIWDTNLSDNSKIGDEFEQNKLTEVYSYRTRAINSRGYYSKNSFWAMKLAHKKRIKNVF